MSKLKLVFATNNKNKLKKQAWKSHEINMNKSLNIHSFFINFHDFFSHEKCIDFSMHFSWKMDSKMEPKSMELKSIKNRAKIKEIVSLGRFGPIWGPFSSKWSPRGLFLEPLEIQKGSTNRHFEHKSTILVLKILSRSASDPNMKKPWKIKGFWVPRFQWIS